MKKLTKDERKGAIALAIVIILIVGGGFILKSINRQDNSRQPEVKILYQPSDTASKKSSRKKDKKVQGGTDKQKDSGPKKSRKKNRSEKRKQVAAPPRDFLTDTIAVRSD